MGPLIPRVKQCDQEIAELTASPFKAWQTSKCSKDAEPKTGVHVRGIESKGADFETNIRKERQLEGIAKAEGVYHGRKRPIDEPSCSGFGPKGLAQLSSLSGASISCWRRSGRSQKGPVSAALPSKEESTRTLICLQRSGF